MRYGIIENCRCVNVIEAEAEFAASMGAVAIPAACGIGDGFDGTVWTAAGVAADPSAVDDLAALAIDHELRLTLIELGVNE